MDLYYKLSKDKLFFISKIDSEIEESISLSMKSEYDDLQDYLKIVGSPVQVLDESYRNMANLLSLTHEEIVRSIPTSTLNRILQNAARVFQDALRDKENELYLVSYMNIKKFFRRLSRPTIDVQKLNKIKDTIEHLPTANRLTALNPDKSGQAPEVVYDMTATSTGRLTVIKGPNILTLPAVSRKSFSSKFPQGKILQVDLTAAEHRIALFYSSIKSPSDIYSHIANTILQGKVTRSEAKLITLCALYGQSPKKLSQALPSSINAREVIRKTKSFFDYENLIGDLRFKNRSNNLRNIIGRPIKVDQDREDLLVSYFLQSSAAELSILMFSEFCDHYKDKVRPIYVVHDALLFDCTHDLSRNLLRKGSVTLKLGKWHFDAKVTDVNN